jgi:hypothetical protein
MKFGTCKKGSFNHNSREITMNIYSITTCFTKFKNFFKERRYKSRVTYGDLIVIGILIIYSELHQIAWWYIFYKGC